MRRQHSPRREQLNPFAHPCDGPVGVLIRQAFTGLQVLPGGAGPWHWTYPGPSAWKGFGMSTKLVWGILGGVVLGAMFGQLGGNTGIGIAICIAAGALAAGVWHYLETRGKRA